MMPTNVAARMTLAAAPDALQGAVAAGILGAGPVILGTAEACAVLLADGQARVAAGGAPAATALALATEIHAAGGKLPGFGHPVHRPLDPRAERILRSSPTHARRERAPRAARARAPRRCVGEVSGRPLPMNVSLPIAAVMLDLGFPRLGREVGADPRAHRRACSRIWLREREQPLGFLMAGAAEDADPATSGRFVMLGSPKSRRDRGPSSWASTRRATASSSPTSSSARPSTATSSRRRGSTRPPPQAGSARSRGFRSPRSASSARLSPRRIRSERTSARTVPRSSASTRRAGPPVRRASFPSPPATSTTGSPARRAATRPRESRPASGSSRPTTQAHSSPGRRCSRSIASGSAISRSAPETPSA